MEKDPKSSSAPEIKIKRTAVDSLKLLEFASEDEFLELIVDLLVEVNSYVCLGACAYNEMYGWQRNYAVVGGNMVRLYKLLHALLDQICQKRGEIVFMIQRLVSESVINILYIIKNFDDDLIDSYVSYSLQHEKKLRDLIDKNVAERGGKMLPIEQRMILSIERTEKASGVFLKNLPEKKIQNWGNKNLFQKAQDVGFETFYLAAIGGGSNGVHGNWQEINGNHLQWDEGSDRFGSLTTWARPRPQLPLALVNIVANMSVYYFDFMVDVDAARIIDLHLRDLLSRIEEVTSAHEKYLTAKTWSEI